MAAGFICSPPWTKQSRTIANWKLRGGIGLNGGLHLTQSSQTHGGCKWDYRPPQMDQCLLILNCFNLKGTQTGREGNLDTDVLSQVDWHEWFWRNEGQVLNVLNQRGSQHYKILPTWASCLLTTLQMQWNLSIYFNRCPCLSPVPLVCAAAWGQVTWVEE